MPYAVAMWCMSWHVKWTTLSANYKLRKSSGTFLVTILLNLLEKHHVWENLGDFQANSFVYLTKSSSE